MAILSHIPFMIIFSASIICDSGYQTSITPDISEKLVNGISKVTDSAVATFSERWPRIRTFMHSTAAWTGGQINRLSEEVVAEYLQGFQNVGAFQKEMVQALRNGEGPDIAQVEGMLERLAHAKDIAELIMYFRDEQSQRKLWEDVKDLTEEAFRAGNKFFSAFILPGSTGFVELEDILATKACSTVGIHYRLKSYPTVWDGGIDPKSFRPGFFEEFQLQAIATHPKRVDRHGSVEFELQLGIEDYSGVYMTAGGNMASTTFWNAHRLAFQLHRDGRSKKYTFRGLKWNCFMGPQQHVETTWQEKILYVVQAFRFLYRPAKMIFEKVRERAYGLQGVEPDLQVLDTLAPEDPYWPISEVQRKNVTEVTPRSLYWGFLGSSWIGMEEMGTGIGATTLYQWDMLSMARDDPMKIVGLISLQTIAAMLGGAASFATLGPWITLVTGGRGTLTSWHMGAQLGTTASDFVLSHTPSFSAHCNRYVDVWGYTYGYLPRHRSRTSFGSKATHGVIQKFFGEMMVPRSKQAHVPLKSGVQITMFFSFYSTHLHSGPEEGHAD